MSSKWFRLVVASVVVGSLYLALQAQEPAAQKPGKGPPADKGKKGKLFDGPAFGGPGKGAGGIFEAIRDKKIQEEIDLLPEQIAELQKVAEQVSADLEPKLRDLKGLPKEEQDARLAELRSELASYLKDVEAEVGKILLPHQQERLRQAALQMRMQKAGSADALLAPDLLRELGISEEQSQQIREKLIKIEEDYRRELEVLAAEKQQRILEQFTPSQREKLKALIGSTLQKQPKPKGGKAPAPLPPAP